MVLKQRHLKEISVCHQHIVGVRGHALLWSARTRVACVLGMVKFTISAQLVRLAQLWNHVAVYHYRLTYGRYFC